MHLVSARIAAHVVQDSVCWLTNRSGMRAHHVHLAVAEWLCNCQALGVPELRTCRPIKRAQQTSLTISARGVWKTRVQKPDLRVWRSRNLRPLARLHGYRSANAHWFRPASRVEVAFRDGIFPQRLCGICTLAARLLDFHLRRSQLGCPKPDLHRLKLGFEDWLTQTPRAGTTKETVKTPQLRPEPRFCQA